MIRPGLQMAGTPTGRNPTGAVGQVTGNVGTPNPAAPGGGGGPVNTGWNTAYNSGQAGSLPINYATNLQTTSNPGAGWNLGYQAPTQTDAAGNPLPGSQQTAGQWQTGSVGGYAAPQYYNQVGQGGSTDPSQYMGNNSYMYDLDLNQALQQANVVNQQDYSNYTTAYSNWQMNNAATGGKAGPPPTPTAYTQVDPTQFNNWYDGFNADWGSGNATGGPDQNYWVNPTPWMGSNPNPNAGYGGVNMSGGNSNNWSGASNGTAPISGLPAGAQGSLGGQSPQSTMMPGQQTQMPPQQFNGQPNSPGSSLAAPIGGQPFQQPQQPPQQPQQPMMPGSGNFGGQAPQQQPQQPQQPQQNGGANNFLQGLMSMFGMGGGTQYGGYNQWGNPQMGNPYGYMTGQQGGYQGAMQNGLINPMMGGGGQLGGLISLLMSGMGGQGGGQYPQQSGFGGAMPQMNGGNLASMLYSMFP